MLQAKAQSLKQLLAGFNLADFQGRAHRVLGQLAAEDNRVPPQRLHGQGGQRAAPMPQIGGFVLVVVHLAAGTQQQQNQRQRQQLGGAKPSFFGHEKLLFSKQRVMLAGCFSLPHQACRIQAVKRGSFCEQGGQKRAKTHGRRAAGMSHFFHAGALQ